MASSSPAARHTGGACDTSLLDGAGTPLNSAPGKTAASLSGPDNVNSN